MTKEELKKHVIHELEWLKYYAREDTRKSLNNNSPIYDQLISIGYAKRVYPLPYRCSSATVKLKNDDCVLTTDTRDINNMTFTALEAWIILYPDSFSTIKGILTNEIVSELLSIS